MSSMVTRHNQILSSSSVSPTSTATNVSPSVGSEHLLSQGSSSGDVPEMQHAGKMHVLYNNVM